ncbi:hypothetical protein B9Z19DRAFT_1087685 [Tuber borchii]|uniref:Uncharacterized protein n=1 Tax=Tuber borchii TaxID=42251 RepID=A0A2T6ZMN4_TUBBO|nr:hypothetical protein B9Z19DRAFT_1087685 [Tuber borchii]
MGTVVPIVAAVILKSVYKKVHRLPVLESLTTVSVLLVIAKTNSRVLALTVEGGVVGLAGLWVLVSFA